MVPPIKRSALSDGGASGPQTRGWLRRRATLRPDLRAAMALEDAGELLEAARVFEYAGEHASAAVLRVEIARTIPDRAQQIDILREGCARIPGEGPEGKLMHAALAELLLAEVEASVDPASRRGAQLEAARALEEADEGAAAGELYEELGLLTRAAAAYERGGEIARLELVLAVLEHQEQQGAQLRVQDSRVDEAIATGHRAEAHALLLERSRGHGGGLPPPHVASRLERLEQRLVRGTELELRWGPGRHTRICGAPRFRIGRAPDAHLVLPAANLSRHHVDLRLDVSGAHTRVVIEDLGSKIGTFVDGESLVPGEPFAIAGPTELGLGVHTAIAIAPIRGADGHDSGAVVRWPGDARAHVWLPSGGRLWLTADLEVPATVLFDRGYVVIDFRHGVHVSLDDRDLGGGASIELLRGDRIALRDAPLRLEVLG